MKRFHIILMVFLGVFVGGCQSLRLMVDNDYSYDTDFTVFKSYAFLNCEIDTSDICSEIHDAIRRQMKARGYVLNEENPDLLVSYSIIKEKVGYKGYNQPSFDRWVNKYDNEEVYKVQTFNFSGGMVLVSLLDASTSRLIWRGYASDVFSEKIREGKTVNYYRNVVRTIFDQYPLFAAGQKPYKITDEVL